MSELEIKLHVNVGITEAELLELKSKWFFIGIGFGGAIKWDEPLTIGALSVIYESLGISKKEFREVADATLEKLKSEWTLKNSENK